MRRFSLLFLIFLSQLLTLPTLGASVQIKTPQKSAPIINNGCVMGTLSDGKGGCYKLPAQGVANCPNIPPPGYTYATGSCAMIPVTSANTNGTTPTNAPAPTNTAAPSTATAPTTAQPQAPMPQMNAPAAPSSSAGNNAGSQDDSIRTSDSTTGASLVASDSNCASPIVFDCDSQTLTFGSGEQSTIACGKDTHSASGKIGAAGKGAGTVFKSMKGAPIINLVPPPCSNCVVHGIPPQNPQNVIAGSSSHGCIHVNPVQLSLLAKCAGTPFQVKSKNGTDSSGTQRRTHSANQ